LKACCALAIDATAQRNAAIDREKRVLFMASSRGIT
jgi:hypothetical protein